VGRFAASVHRLAYNPLSKLPKSRAGADVPHIASRSEFRVFNLIAVNHRHHIPTPSLLWSFFRTHKARTRRRLSILV